MDRATLLGWSLPPWTSCPIILKAGDQAMAHLISWHTQNSSPLVSWCLDQTKLGSPPNSSSLPPLPDHRGCLTGGTCCSGVELPAPQVGLGAACSPFLAAKVHWQHHHFSHLADGSPLEDKEASALCWRSRYPPPHPSQTLLGELSFPPKPA